MGLDTFIDKIRINKFAGAMVAGGSFALLNLYNSIQSMDDFDFRNLAPIAAHAVSALIEFGVAVCTTKKQNQRYEGIVDGIERHGYNERFCSMYMDHLCGRSVVKTALERTDNFHEYVQLKEKYPITKIV